MPPRSRRTQAPPAEDVRLRWKCLSLPQRQLAMCFDDPHILERITSALQSVHEMQTVLQQFGVKLFGDTDPLAESAFMKAAFEFTVQVGRNTKDPAVMLLHQSPVLKMKDAFLQREDMLDYISEILPDFLNARESGRQPMPKARWKELWAVEPSSAQAIEKQLAKLVEQSLWALTAKAPTPIIEEAVEEVLPEDWIDSEDDKAAKAAVESPKKQKKKQKQKQKKKASTRTASTGADDLELDASEPLVDSNLSEAASATPAGGDVDTLSCSGMATSTWSPSIGCMTSMMTLPTPPTPFSRQDTAAMSDGEESYVGMGTMHMSIGAASSPLGVSSWEPTASSTPAESSSWAHKVQKSVSLTQPVTPPASPRPCSSSHGGAPLRSGKAPHPPHLVCYIWHQASDIVSTRFAAAAVSNDVVDAPGVADSAAGGAEECETPSMRRFGQWLRPNGTGSALTSSIQSPACAVVRNTFVTIDDPDEESETVAPPLRARSVSPMPSWQGLCDRTWYKASAGL
eukprot:TRINITY_DN92744_c0_g1_i1.p1 TRINITY_DN92744_c0_g1~~TRINITY_DN92744_c0_g1_i1.p1  ORF type:complete len:513 (+),score=98.83 TRINITY_DN92744_c0_g1_i1:236-1774(+)